MLLPKTSIPRWIIIVMDLFLSLLSLFFAYLIRFDLKADTALFQQEWEILSKSIGFYFLVKFVVFYLFKIHKGLIRHTSTADFRRLFFAILTTSIVYFVGGLVRLYFMDGFFLFPMSVLLIEFLASIMALVGARFFIKLMYLESIKIKNSDERILIYGAGISGLITKRTIEKDQRISYQIIGFVDDNKKMSGSRLEGLAIFHSSKLETLIKDEGVTQLIIAIQDPSEENKKRIIDVCLNNNVTVQQVPNPKSWINGEFSTKQISKIKIEDLLGRKPIVLDEQKISSELNNKTILVTGAAGSIGSGMVLQIAKYQPLKVVLLDQAESPMYDIQNQLLTQFPDLIFEVVIGDIRNYERMERVFEYYRPEYVFHAAAYKHVPLMETYNVSEALINNIIGTYHLAQIAKAFKVNKFILVSTDKAVNPTSVMGASKYLAEVICRGLQLRSKTDFVITRFGNVLGSSGSVIPKFREQIAAGGPVTLTHPEMTRYFMSIPEAAQLVMQASLMGKSGQIYVLDMGESVKIVDLASDMIKLSGFERDDIKIKFTGLRPGEKLYEELLGDNETFMPTTHPKLKIASSEHISEKTVKDLIKWVLSTTSKTETQIKKELKRWVKGYSVRDDKRASSIKA